ncbi:MAG: hypothetical protein ACRDPA_32950 [Solirubrobacteraceae bacterium]
MTTGLSRLGSRGAPPGTDSSRADADLARRVIPFAVAAALPFLLTLVFAPSGVSAGFVVS